MNYDNSTRELAALENRKRLLAAARTAFLERGYAGTTVRAVAVAAGMSQETVYKVYGGKAGLLKAVYDVMIAGDDEPVPVADRSHAQAVRDAQSPQDSAAAWAAMVLTLGNRIGPMQAVLQAARSTDPAIEALLSTVDSERLTGATMLARHWASRRWLRDDAPVEDHAVTLWTLSAPETRRLLASCGWDDDRYSAWLVSMVTGSVLTVGHRPR